MSSKQHNAKLTKEALAKISAGMAAGKGGSQKPSGQMDLKTMLKSNEMQKFITEMNNSGPVKSSGKTYPGKIVGPGSGVMLRNDWKK